MSRQWRLGPSDAKPAWLRLAIALVILAGLGWLYGSRFWTMARFYSEVGVYDEQAESLRQEIAQLEQKLAQADDPNVVEAEARRLLRLGFPTEELVILIWR